ncbi:MAG TPA: leucine-rich repeat domain-containing protein, partial [Candidatus Atribacteria bacterium]|nr:leucine-rich repeat domain-containing protein [Candidatus Atribacteria bacterium]
MKRKIISFIFIGIVIFSSTFVFLSEIEAEEEVTFPDKNLENAIREKIGKNSGPIYESDLEQINRLEANGKNIKSVGGLEHCKNLKYLYLWNNNISDLSPLSNLTNLTELDLGNNSILDINPLSNLTNLTKLYLWQNKSKISDI